MNKFLQIVNLLVPFEEKIIPVFVHNANSQQVAGIILVAESFAAQVAQELAKLPTNPAPSEPTPPTT